MEVIVPASWALEMSIYSELTSLSGDAFHICWGLSMHLPPTPPLMLPAIFPVRKLLPSLEGPASCIFLKKRGGAGQRRRKGKKPISKKTNSNHMHHSPAVSVSAATCGPSRGSAISGAPASSLKPGWILAPEIREEGQAAHPPSLGMISLTHRPQGTWWVI